MEMQVKGYPDKIVATVGELEFVHKYGTHIIEVYKGGEMFVGICMMQTINPAILTSVVGYVIKNIDQIQKMKSPKTGTVEYEKRAMQMN